jgi:hypothetical protein
MKLLAPLAPVGLVLALQSGGCTEAERHDCSVVVGQYTVTTYCNDLDGHWQKAVLFCVDGRVDDGHWTNLDGRLSVALAPSGCVIRQGAVDVA